MNEKGPQATHGRTKLIQNVGREKGIHKATKESQGSLGVAGKRREKSCWIESGDNDCTVCRILTIYVDCT